MLGTDLYQLLVSYCEEAVTTKKSAPLLEKVRALNPVIEGESHYARLKCSFVCTDGHGVQFSYRSYDPSGPFQNLPDVNKIEVSQFLGALAIASNSFDFEE